MALERAAATSNQSVSEEIGARLAASFDGAFGDIETYALCRLIAAALSSTRMHTGRAWHQHPWAFREGREAVLELLSYFQPIGEAEVPDDAPMIATLRNRGRTDDQLTLAKQQLRVFHLGRTCARLTVAAIESDQTLRDAQFPREVDRLNDIKSVLLARLVAADTTGEALADLTQEPPVFVEPGAVWPEGKVEP